MLPCAPLTSGRIGKKKREITIKNKRDWKCRMMVEKQEGN
jgi:hypothetical protein